jgi:hypothetical protein
LIFESNLLLQVICKSNNPAKGGGLNTSQIDLGFHARDLQENKKAGDFHRRLFS